jgi:hypothetical protein
MTGRREVDTRYLMTHSGGIVPFRGRGATWIANSTIPNPSGMGKSLIRRSFGMAEEAEETHKVPAVSLSGSHAETEAPADRK